ncbi:bifunctional histidinol-phosphatase/imidazoleglycerol-phosphate dehydratase HisB [Buchnera aphidicola]|uniref:bifunctional histidinol-phosphatase/imidazoleglycerol-phosphate dehydratase HisB n=1 Tax=Buchnera aphidicola TaxID=9 RepID=UPI0031B8578A
MLKKYLFIDRDGTLISEPVKDFQIDNIEKLFFEPEVIPSLIILKNNGYKFVMITNQDGLGSKNFSLSAFNIPHNFMLKIFNSQGIFFEKVLICPHYSYDNCTCRKPNIELVKPWLDLNILNKTESYVIGDRTTDLKLANNMGIKGILYNKNTCNWSKIVKTIINCDRYAKICRNTKETNIIVEIWLDRYSISKIDTQINFFNHMLEQISVHSGILMNVIARGDIQVDDHHIIEDVGICLGQALFQAIGNKYGLNRYGFYLPMDESLAQCVLDVSGRPYLKFSAIFNHKLVGDMNTEMVQHFFYSLAYSMKSTIHISVVGENDHHKIESLFKVFGRVLKDAILIKGNHLLSSKGIL